MEQKTAQGMVKGYSVFFIVISIVMLSFAHKAFLERCTTSCIVIADWRAYAYVLGLIFLTSGILLWMMNSYARILAFVVSSFCIILSSILFLFVNAASTVSSIVLLSSTVLFVAFLLGFYLFGFNKSVKALFAEKVG
jgi:hypothetical protein